MSHSPQWKLQPDHGPNSLKAIYVVGVSVRNIGSQNRRWFFTLLGLNYVSHLFEAVVLSPRRVRRTFTFDLVCFFTAGSTSLRTQAGP